MVQQHVLSNLQQVLSKLQHVLSNLSIGDWAAIATAVGTLVLAFVAALQDVIRSWIRRPVLKMTVRGAPPDCHLTRATFKTVAGIDSVPCYYTTREQALSL
jgi:hypothetical protein